MWREVVMVLSGGKLERKFEEHLLERYSVSTVENRHLHLVSRAGHEMEVVFDALEESYTPGEHAWLAQAVPDPRLILILYMDYEAISGLVAMLPDIHPLFDVEEPGSLTLLPPAAALENLRTRSN